MIQRAGDSCFHVCQICDASFWPAACRRQQCLEPAIQFVDRSLIENSLTIEPSQLHARNFFCYFASEMKPGRARRTHAQLRRESGEIYIWDGMILQSEAGVENRVFSGARGGANRLGQLNKR